MIVVNKKSIKSKEEQKRLVLSEIQEIQAFRRVLRREDQKVLDDILARAQKHERAGELVEHALPLEITLLCMLVEQQREIMRLRGKVEKDRDLL
jgi:hypothetical protein